MEWELERKLGIDGINWGDGIWLLLDLGSI